MNMQLNLRLTREELFLAIKQYIESKGYKAGQINIPVRHNHILRVEAQVERID